MGWPLAMGQSVSFLHGERIVFWEEETEYEVWREDSLRNDTAAAGAKGRRVQRRMQLVVALIVTKLNEEGEEKGYVPARTGGSSRR